MDRKLEYRIARLERLLNHKNESMDKEWPSNPKHAPWNYDREEFMNFKRELKDLLKRYDLFMHVFDGDILFGTKGNATTAGYWKD